MKVKGEEKVRKLCIRSAVAFSTNASADDVVLNGESSMGIRDGV